MKTKLFAAVSALALLAVSTPAAATQMNMPGMPGMKMPTTKKASGNKKATTAKNGKVAKKTAHARSAAKKGHAKNAEPKPQAGGRISSTPAMKTPSGQSRPGMAVLSRAAAPGMTVPQGLSMPSMQMPTASAPGAHVAPPMGQMPGMESAHGGNMGHMAMTGALGSHPMERESSGTAWQPDTSKHAGLMSVNGDWTLMAHGVVNLVFDHQSGSRGGDKAFASGMLMGMARRPLGNGTLQFKAMLKSRPTDGAQWLSVASRQRRDRERTRPADRPSASP